MIAFGWVLWIATWDFSFLVEGVVVTGLRVLSVVGCFWLVGLGGYDDSSLCRGLCFSLRVLVPAGWGCYIACF